jgi:hypothetical protein
MSNMNNLWGELKEIVWGRMNIVEFVFPVLAYLLAKRYLTTTVSLIISGVIILYFFIKKRQKAKDNIYLSLIGSLGLLSTLYLSEVLKGLGGVLLSGIVTDILLVAFGIISLFLHLPLVALTSQIVRRWPVGWYRHPRVLPAYREVTIGWIIYSLLRILIGILGLNNTNWQTLVTIISGLPMTILLLVISYLYGIKRLANLKGPSVEEFKNSKNPPWESQTKGF